MRTRSEHVRSIARSPAEVFAALERVGTEDDSLWPAPSIPFERTPGPLRIGETRERHGIIRAVLDELDENRRMIWRCNQSFLKGTHGFEIVETAMGCDVAHVLDAELAWWFVPAWIVKVRGVHDWIVERLLDGLEALDRTPTSTEPWKAARQPLASTQDGLVARVLGRALETKPRRGRDRGSARYGHFLD